MKNKILIIVSLIFIFTQVFAERIELSIKYLGLRVVKVLIEDNNNVLSVSAKATSLASVAASMDNIYLVRYTGNYLPEKYSKKVNQRKYFEDRSTTYNRVKKKAYRESFIDSIRNCEYEINPLSRDFFSALFYLRTAIDKEVGNMWLDANKVIWEAHFEVVEKESIKCILGDINTIKVKIDFKKISPEESERSDMLTNNLVSEKNSLYFWFSDDSRRIPVKAKFTLSPFPIIWKLKEYQE